MKRAFLFLTSLIVISAGIAFCAKSKEPKTMLYKVKNVSDVKELFPNSPKEIESATEHYIQTAQEAIDKIVAIPSEKRTFANTIKAFDDIEGLSDLALFAGIAEVLQYTCPNDAIRAAAHDALIKIQEFAVDALSNNVILYKAIKSYADNQAKNEQLSAEERYYLNKTMDDFKRSGLDLPVETLDEVKKLKKELASLQLDFETNVSSDNRTISVQASDLAGLSEDFLASLKKTEDGAFILGVDVPTFIMVMENCSVEQTRKALNAAHENRGYPANEKVLNSVIAKRDRMAKLLGFASFADYDLSNQMVESVDRAENFIAQLMEKAHVKEQQEFDEVITDLAPGVHLTDDGKLKIWDAAYAKNYFKKKHYNVDEQKVAEYFPMEKTVKGLLDIYQQFLSLTLKEVPVSGYWHEDVKLVETYDAKTNQLIGYLLLDLHPRPHKYTHACHIGVLPSTYAKDQMIPAVSVVVANFPKSTAHKPSLLKRKDVSTFFHEFGHALHALLGRTQIASLAGTQVKRDFVELPSQMLEEWLKDKEILKQVSSHYQTDEPMDDGLIERIVALNNFGSGAFLQSQLFYSLISLQFYKDGENKNCSQIYKDLYAQCKKNIAYDPEDHMYAAFGHLMGYGARYYGYMWSKVFALDMFDTIKKGGLLNPETGDKYVATVIGKGGSEDPNVLLHNFLGREPNQEAFLRDMGLNVQDDAAQAIVAQKIPQPVGAHI